MEAVVLIRERMVNLVFSCEMRVHILNINSTILSSTIDTVGTLWFWPL